MITAIIILSIVIVALLGLCFLVNRRANSESVARVMAEQQLNDLRTENARLEERVLQQGREAERVATESENRFKALAADIMQTSTKVLQEQNSVGLRSALDPVKADFEAFRRVFNEHTKSVAAAREVFDGQIKNLMESNGAVGREARALTEALKGNTRVQGHWGEMMLQNILERCGLVCGRDFETQQTVNDDEMHRLRPDVVINCSNERKLVVDSKTSLTDFIRMLNADNDDARRKAAIAHVASVRKHIGELREKQYQKSVLGSVDFVLMFIPNESALSTAIDLAPEISDEARKAGVYLVSPSMLLMVLGMVENMARREKQDRNAEEIANRATLMLDKLQTFLTNMTAVDKAISETRAAWDEAHKVLCTGTGNLMSQVRKLQTLGARSRKTLPSVFTENTNEESQDA